MRAERTLRLPLQVGTSALLSLARGALLGVPGVIMFTIAVVIILWLPDMGDLSGYLFAVIVTPGAVTSFYAYRHLKRAHAERPSDLYITADAFRVDGGPHHGLHVTWAALQRVSISTGLEAGEDDTDQCLMTIAYDQHELVLAAAERFGEQKSLEELALTLDAACHRDTTIEPPTTAVDVFTCSHCSAAIAPAGTATVVCPYCKDTVTVPDAVRAQIRDAEAVRSKPDAAIAKLLDQPGATLVGSLFVVASAFMLVAWPLAIALMTMEYVHHTLTLAHVLELLGFVAASILGFYALIRTRLVDRQALRLVAVDFSAVEPAKPGEPYRCKRCLAPLPAAEATRVLVRCLYCATDNVLGLHLGRQATIAREESDSLEDAIARRKREHRNWRGVVFLALGLLFVSWLALRHSTS